MRVSKYDLRWRLALAFTAMAAASLLYIGRCMWPSSYALRSAGLIRQKLAAKLPTRRIASTRHELTTGQVLPVQCILRVYLGMIESCYPQMVSAGFSHPHSLVRAVLSSQLSYCCWVPPQPTHRRHRTVQAIWAGCRSSPAKARRRQSLLACALRLPSSWRKLELMTPQHEMTIPDARASH
jgi:hypothetical protein